MSSRRAVLSGLAGICLAAVTAFAQPTPALSGTWKFNPEKSKYTPGPMPQRETVTYASVKNGVHYTVTATEANGASTRLTGTLVYDGKEYPTSGSPDYDTLVTKQINAYTTETTRKKNGKVVQTAVREVSKDGATLTLRTKGTTARGTTIDNVGVYERQ